MATFVKFAVYKPMGFPLRIHYIDTAGNPIIGADGQPMIKLIDLTKTAATESDGFIDLKNVLYAQAIDGYEFTSNINTGNAEESKTLVGAETGEISGAPENRKVTIGSYTGYQLRFIKYDNGTFYAAMGNRTGNNRFIITGKPAVYLTYKLVFAPAFFEYTEKVQTFTVPMNGTFRIQLWGAQGGTVYDYQGGKGGYSEGVITLTANQKLYLAIGGCGKATSGASNSTGGWNGGGRGTYNRDQYDELRQDCKGDKYSSVGSGGGATSVQSSLISDGQLSSYSSNKENVVLVAGGGGGSMYWPGGYGNPVQYGYGGAGGGISGVDGSNQFNHTSGKGGNQSRGGSGGASGSFGRGGYISSQTGSAGGGGGYYGGGCSNDNAGGGGGSGYIGSIVSSGQTIAGNQSITEPDGTTATGHSGNGYARITLVT